MANKGQQTLSDNSDSDNGEKDVDDRNQLNSLNGSEWIHFLKSVEVTAFPTSGKNSMGHKIRKEHPSPKPPQLMKDIIKFFTKKDGSVLDPFVGVGGTLIGCSLSGREGVGIDLNEEYLDLYEEVCEKEGFKQQKTVLGDARDIDEFEEIKDRKFDLILTDPPYGNMMNKEKTGEAKKKGEDTHTPYTESEKDIGNLENDKFLGELRNIMETSITKLKTDGHLVMFIKDHQPEEDDHMMLHSKVVEELMKIDNLEFRGYKVWFDKTQNLYPFGYPYQFVANIMHQYILVFRKLEDKN